MEESLIGQMVDIRIMHNAAVVSLSFLYSQELTSSHKEPGFIVKFAYLIKKRNTICYSSI